MSAWRASGEEPVEWVGEEPEISGALGDGGERGDVCTHLLVTVKDASKLFGSGRGSGSGRADNQFEQVPWSWRQLPGLQVEGGGGSRKGSCNCVMWKKSRILVLK